MLQQQPPEGFVITTGPQHSVLDFIATAAFHLEIEVEWHGTRKDETGTGAKVDLDAIHTLIALQMHGEIAATRDAFIEDVTGWIAFNAALIPGHTIIRVDPRYFRPTEVETLLGDASRAHAKLGWAPATPFSGLVSEMVSEDFAQARRDSLCLHAGFDIHEVRE